MKAWRVAYGLVWGVALSAFAQATGSLSIPLTVTDRIGVARVAEPVLSGVPLPRAAQILDTSDLSLIDGATGQVIDADWVVSARWGGAPDDVTKPIKWLLASFKASVAANASKTFYLTDYQSSPPAQVISLIQGGSIWTVDTGVAQFEISNSGFDLFHRVTLNGIELVTPSAANGPYYTLAGTTYNAPLASGGSTLSVYRHGARGQTLTLQIKGAHRSYAPGNATLSSDDDIDINAFLTFTAGLSVVKVHYTVQNNRNWIALQNNADFRNMGSSNSVYADELGLKLGLSLGSSPTWQLATSPVTVTTPTALAQTVSVYQDSSGDPLWDYWKNVHATGAAHTNSPIYGPASYVSFQGYQIKQGSTQSGSGSKMSGYLDAVGSNGGVTVAVRDFWQNFPKALRVTSAGEVQVALFPADFRARHTLRVGEQKSHEILFYFHGAEATDIANVGGGFAQPLFALAPGAWYAETTRTIASVSTSVNSDYRFSTIAAPTNLLQADVTPAEWDSYLLRQLIGPGVPSYSGNSTNDYSFNGLDEAVPAAQMYSWMDYGDVPIDFEAQWEVFPTTLACSGATRSVTGQYGWKYDGDYGLFLAFLRSGDYRFFDYALPAVRHSGDIDYLHHGRQSGRGIHSFLDGGSFAHSEHNTDGDRNPHRNGTDPNYDAASLSCTGGDVWNGTPVLDMVYGAKALALGYFLTGEPPLKESLLDLGAWVPYMVDNWNDNGVRGTTNALESLTALVWLTGDPTYRNKADFVASTNTPLQSPLGTGWFASRMGAAFGEYVATLREQDDTSQDARLELVASGAQSLDAYSGDAFRGDAYGWAAMLLPHGRAGYMADADEAFTSAVLWPAFYNNYYGIQRVWQIKEWMNALRSGHAYQLAKFDQRGGFKFTPQAPPISFSGGSSLQNTAPIAVISGGITTSGGTSQPIIFDGSFSNDVETASNNLIYLWDFGDNITTAGRIVEHTFVEAGTYQVRLWVSDGKSVSLAQQSALIAFVNHAPVAQAGSDRIAPQGIAMLFDASASSDMDGQMLTYSWDFGDGSLIVTGVSASHAYLLPGHYVVTLTVSDGSLLNVDTAMIEVGAISATPVASSFQQGIADYTGVRDVRLWSNYAAGNYGGDTELYIGNAGANGQGKGTPELVTLLSFDLSSIPTGARIDSAQLIVTASRAGSFLLDVHRVQQAWTEGTGTWGNTTDGATWNAYDGIHAWANPGADYAVFSASFNSPAIVGQTATVDVTAIVQMWMLGIENNGFALTINPSLSWAYAYLYSRNSPTPAYGPRLTVNYRSPLLDPIFSDGFDSP